MRTFILSIFLSLFFMGCGEDSTFSDPINTDKETIDPVPFDGAVILDENLKADYLRAINNARSVSHDCGMNQDTGEVYGVMPAVDSLVWNDMLYNSSYEHSLDLAESDTFSHTGSGTSSDWTAVAQDLVEGSKVQDRIENNGYLNWITIGENISAGTYQDLAQEAVNAWLASPPHCANLMNPVYKDVGMGHVMVFESSFTHYWTQNFGAK